MCALGREERKGVCLCATQDAREREILNRVNNVRDNRGRVSKQHKVGERNVECFYFFFCISECGSVKRGKFVMSDGCRGKIGCLTRE